MMNDNSHAITQTLTWLTVGFTALTLQQWLAITALIISYLSYRIQKKTKQRMVELAERREERELRKLELEEAKHQWELERAESDEKRNGNHYNQL